MNKTGAAGAGDDSKNGLEWTVFAISLLLVLTILGYLAYQVFVYQEASPDVYAEARHDPSGSNPNRYLVQVHNRGGMTAENVVIEVSVMNGETELEKAALEIAFVPKESKREGWVNFSNKVSHTAKVETQIVSYNKP